MVGFALIVFLSIISAIYGHYFVHWIGDGGICKTSHGEVLNCVHSDSCFPKYYREPENQPIVCGIRNWVTIMCCANNDAENRPNANKLYPNNDHLSIILNQNFPCSNPIQNPSNTDEQSWTNNRPKQKGQQIEENDIGQSSTSTQEMVAQNVTINFPFYRPSSENSTSLRNCKRFLQNQIQAVFIGVNANSGEYKHMAALGYGNEENTEWLCGGSLISENFVLTAAHCRASNRYGPLKFVRLGAWDIRNISDPNAKTFGIDTIISHPLYVRRESYHDIALIKLKETVLFDLFIKPACLATTWDLRDITLDVTGWGLTETLESASILQTARLQYVSTQRCQSIYENSRGLKAGIIETLQICADGVKKGSDTCQGDSGGPLQFKNNFYDFGSFWEIVGITSTGMGCGLTAGVYTRVLPYLPWIEGIVWPNE